MNALELRVFIYMQLTNLINQKNVTFPDMPLEFSDNVMGTLNISDVLVTGFETIENNINNIEVTEDENNNNDVCLLIPVGYLQSSLNYVADIGINDEIPIYGDGIFSFGMTNIKINVCFYVNFDERYIGDVVFQCLYRHGPVELTGFWKNEQVSLILKGLLNAMNRFYAMWSAYEPEQASCLTTPFMSYIFNVWFGNENATFEFDDTCFQKMFYDGTEDRFLDLEKQVLQKLLETQGDDDTDIKLNTFIEENKSTVLPIIKHIGDIVLKLF